MDTLKRLSTQNAVVIFSVSSCCMCHTVKRLFFELGVALAIHELDEDPAGGEMGRAVSILVGHSPAVPVVFIGGRLIGSTREVMALHLGGKLVPLLRDAGALWL